MAVKVTERKRKAFESKIKGANKVEIKITVTPNDEERTYEALDIKNSDAGRREIYFFDNPKLTLNKAGVVLRARAIEDDDHDSVVKIRPVDPEKIDAKWQDTAGFKVEADSVGNKVVMSASLKAQQKKSEIEKVVNNKHVISDLFSKKQKEFLAEFYEGPVNLDDLTILGPVKALRADIERPGTWHTSSPQNTGLKLLEDTSYRCRSSAHRRKPWWPGRCSRHFSPATDWIRTARRRPRPNSP